MPVCWFSSNLGDLAHATVTGLPAETVGPAEVPQAGEVLPQHTAPGVNFGKEVGSAATGERCPQSFVPVLSANIYIYIHPVGGAKDSPTGSSEPGGQG